MALLAGQPPVATTCSQRQGQRRQVQHQQLRLGASKQQGQRAQRSKAANLCLALRSAANAASPPSPLLACPGSSSTHRLGLAVERHLILLLVERPAQRGLQAAHPQLHQLAQVVGTAAAAAAAAGGDFWRSGFFFQALVGGQAGQHHCAVLLRQVVGEWQRTRGSRAGSRGQGAAPRSCGFTAGSSCGSGCVAGCGWLAAHPCGT